MNIKFFTGCTFYVVTACAAFGADHLPSAKKIAALEQVFGDEEEVLNDVDAALVKGYGALLDDVRAGVYSGVTEKQLEKYLNSDLEVRTIGFPNWITTIRGHILLQKAKIARLELQLLQKGGKGATPAARKKTTELAEMMKRLAELEKRFVD